MIRILKGFAGLDFSYSRGDEILAPPNAEAIIRAGWAEWVK